MSDKLNGYCTESIEAGLNQLRDALEESGFDTRQFTTYGLIIFAADRIRSGTLELAEANKDITIMKESIISKPPQTHEQKIEAWKHNLDAYYRSRWWAKQRMKALSNSRYKCEICSSTDNLQVHHLTYETIGRERPEDLQVLCFYCHRKVHAHKASIQEKIDG